MGENSSRDALSAQAQDSISSPENEIERLMENYECWSFEKSINRVFFHRRTACQCVSLMRANFLSLINTVSFVTKLFGLLLGEVT